ncbi:hypothetical protein SSBR45G_02440 [Bradyrhizobium sp. SSBR45G]|uniref:porin n=1 Tax=unclassified Bradyrhizobium TaxID=2631580 RepID=UPI002342BC1F|nr:MULTISPECIES: porin [unclassified Bradyrhizobium]GLH75336.1 hypothetical protein SSBR45G_02440 [Bradyrhizobium sp. SSBR45G]GLH82877.1 hypothetical protein SSBR45R_03370 [Bradyrhizobium sp. SSBR45R]
MCRSVILGTVAWLAVVGTASAGSPGSSLLAPKAPEPSKPARPATTPINPCAAYGANFARVAGTDTCVKVGGAVRVEMGTSTGR